MNYSDANNYRTRKYNITTEEIPANVVFKTYPGETHVFEDRDKDISYYCIIKALETGNITELDKKAVCIIAKFSAGCLTTKQLRELLFMIGAEFSEKVFESSVARLHRYQLVNFSRFKSPDYDKQSNFRVLTLTEYGSRLAKALSVNHRYNGIALAAAMPHEVKSRCATAQLVVQFLKHFPAVDEYHIRPVVVVNPDNHAIVRPAASLKIDGEWLNIESPRRVDGYLENLIDTRCMMINCILTIAGDKLFGEENNPMRGIDSLHEKMAGEIRQKLQCITYKDKTQKSKSTAVISEEKIFEKIREIIVEQLGVPETKVTHDAFIVDDLRADSLDAVELIMALEEEFEIEIPDGNAEHFITVADVEKYIKNNFGE